jgi:hypothetical protein
MPFQRPNMRVHFPLVAVAWIALAGPCSLGQAGSSSSASSSTATAPYVPTMTFDVTSVRESKPDANAGFRVGGGFQPPNSGNLRLENNGFMNLILWAYEVNPHLIEGIPRDLAWATFNVEAKADGETDVKLATLTKEQIRLEIRL